MSHVSPQSHSHTYAHLTLSNIELDFSHGFSLSSGYMHSIKLDMPTFNFTQDLQDSFKYGINTT